MRCHRCAAVLDDIEPRDLGSDVVDYASLGLRGRQCGVCRWPNLTDVPPRRADLGKVREELAASGVPGVRLELTDTRTTGDAVERALRAVQSLWSVACAQLRGMVDGDPEQALAWLLASIGGVRREPSMMADAYALSDQVVYASLLTSGPLNVFAREVPVDEEWSGRLARLAGLMVSLSSVKRSLDPEVCGDCTISDGTVGITATDAGRLALETNLYNGGTFGGTDHDLGDPTGIGAAVQDVERACFGVGLEEVLQLLLASVSGGGAPLSGMTRVTVADGLMYVDLRIDGDAPWLVRLLREVFVLNPHHWHVRAVPSFFFADTRPAQRSDGELVETAASLDWLRFAPLLCGGYVDGGELQVVGVTTYGLLWRALQRCRGALSSRLHLVETTGRARATAAGDEAATRAQQVHAEFERSIVRRCQSVGVAAEHSVQRVAGKTIPCGEIDFLAFTADNTGQPVAVVGECKDIDVVFYKDGGIEQAMSVATHAAEQVQRKATWVRHSWEAVADQFERPRAAPHVVGVVVTRNVALPTLQNNVPVLHPEEIPAFVGMLRDVLQPIWPVLAQQEWFMSGDRADERTTVAGGPGGTQLLLGYSTSMTSSAADQGPTNTPLPDRDPGDEEAAGPDAPARTEPPAGASDDQDTGGPDTQLAPEKD
jgi:hypothetical protein